MNPPNPFLPPPAGSQPVTTTLAPNVFGSTERLPPPASFGSTLPLTTPAPAAPAPVNIGFADMRMNESDATHEDAAPSRADLLQRAAELGPSRMTYENILLAPTDPILANKMQPRVAERRARFRKMVKVALGACVALCVVGTAASALSSSTPATSASSTSAKAAPATGVVTVEKLDQPTHTKAASHGVTAAARPAVAPKLAKRR